MEAARSQIGGGLGLAIAGRLDGTGSNDLRDLLEESLRAGHRELFLDLSEVAYLSSAGIGVIVQYYKRLRELNGDLRIFQASQRVIEVLDLTGLGKLLVRPLDPAAAPGALACTRVERDGVAVESCVDFPSAMVTAHLAGNAAHLLDPPPDWMPVHFDCAPDTMAVGLGVLGEETDEARVGIGEFLAAAGCALHQPTAGHGASDYMAAEGAFVPRISAISALVCRGKFARSARFEPSDSGGPVSLTALTAICRDLAESNAVAMVILAESAGLVGAALRRSPLVGEGALTFRHPDVRSWLSFTAESAFTESTVLIAGVAAAAAPSHLSSAMRPMGGLWGHFHAAAFSYRPLPKGMLSLAETSRHLVQTQRLDAVLHLLADDRAGARRESEFRRGMCWFGPVVEAAK